MTGTPPDDVRPEDSEQAERRPGSRAIASFAVGGLVLALGIGAWTWSTSVPEPTHATDNTLASQQTGHDASSSTKHTPHASDDPRTDNAKTSASKESNRGGNPVDTSLESDDEEGSAYPRTQQAPRSLAPLGNGDPLLPPDSWSGSSQAVAPSHTIIAEAAPNNDHPSVATPQQTEPKSPDESTDEKPTQDESTKPTSPAKPKPSENAGAPTPGNGTPPAETTVPNEDKEPMDTEDPSTSPTPNPMTSPSPKPSTSDVLPIPDLFKAPPMQ